MYRNSDRKVQQLFPNRPFTLNQFEEVDYMIDKLAKLASAFRYNVSEEQHAVTFFQQSSSISHKLISESSNNFFRSRKHTEREIVSRLCLNKQRVQKIDHIALTKQRQNTEVSDQTTNIDSETSAKLSFDMGLFLSLQNIKCGNMQKNSNQNTTRNFLQNSVQYHELNHKRYHTEQNEEIIDDNIKLEENENINYDANLLEDSFIIKDNEVFGEQLQISEVNTNLMHEQNAQITQNNEQILIKLDQIKQMINDKTIPKLYMFQLQNLLTEIQELVEDEIQN